MAGFEPIPLLIRAGAVVADSSTFSPGWVLTDGAGIAALGPGPAPVPAGRVRPIDAPELTLRPGFVDLHVHGGDGVDVMDADPDGLRTLARFHARRGVTALVPTTWAAPEADLHAALEAIRRTTGAVDGGATILGAHLEGPWISPRRAGAQDPDQIRLPDVDEARRLLASGAVRRVTLAPERPGAAALIATLRADGVSVSAGHTDATFDEISRAAVEGVDSLTHVYNAMSPFGHREPGAVGAALTLRGLACEVIADFVHVHPAALLLLARAKRPGGVVLISDAIRAAGLPDGPVDLGGRPGSCCGGAVRLPDGTLAGSVLTLDEAVRNLARVTGWDGPALAAASAGNAARLLGEFHKGRLAVGCDADLVGVDADGTVHLTVALGRVVYEAEP